MPIHIRWNSIGLLHNVIRTLDLLHSNDRQPLPVVEYRAKVKLHGANCGVQITPEGCFPQSRSKLISPGSDYKGFANWVDANSSYFEALPSDITLFGEWCGPGIEKGMAISAIDRKIFVVFALQYGREEEARIEFEPQTISQVLPEHPELFVLPWYGDSMTLDYGDKSCLENATSHLNQMVTDVEKEDPWVKVTFGKEGLGEGLVFYPAHGPYDPEGLAQLMFKAKGEKHRSAGSKKAVQMMPDVVKNVDAFVALMVTEARLEQGVSEACERQFEMRAMGQLLRWISSDVEKESVAELEASGLAWKQVAKAVQTRAREWYKAKVLGQ